MEKKPTIYTLTLKSPDGHQASLKLSQGLLIEMSLYDPTMRQLFRALCLAQARAVMGEGASNL